MRTKFYQHKETGVIKSFAEITEKWGKGYATREEANADLEFSRSKFKAEYEPYSEFHPLLKPFETTVILGNDFPKPVFIITDEFLLVNLNDHSIWEGCPHIINDSVIECIKEVKSAGNYPYNTTVGDLFCSKHGVKYIEHSLIGSVVYCCQTELRKREDEAHEQNMINQGWLVLNTEVAQKAIETGKKLIIEGKKQTDWLTSSVSKEKPYRVMKCNDGRYFLISPGKRNHGYYVQNLMRPYNEYTTFCKIV